MKYALEAPSCGSRARPGRRVGLTAARYNASSPEDTQDGELAYARFPPAEPTRYRDGLLPT